MHWRIRHSDRKGQTQTDDQTHPDGKESGGWQVSSMFDEVESAEHEHRVGEHQKPSRDHLHGVKEDGLGTHIAEAGIKNMRLKSGSGSYETDFSSKYLLPTLANTVISSAECRSISSATDFSHSNVTGSARSSSMPALSSSVSCFISMIDVVLISFIPKKFIIAIYQMTYRWNHYQMCKMDFAPTICPVEFRSISPSKSE